jgi:chromosome segregation ATPase
MANDNKKINELVSDQDDEPTVEFEILPEAIREAVEADRAAEVDSDGNTVEFSRPDIQTGDANQTISNLRADLESRAESIDKLQFDIEQLRSRWIGLEKEINVREAMTNKLTEELKLAHSKQSHTDRLLEKRENEIELLESQLSSKEQALKESALQIEKAGTKGQESESRVVELQAQLHDAEEKLSASTNESQIERSEHQATREQARLLAVEVDKLNKEVVASRDSVSGLQRDIDCRKSDWDKQESRLLESEDKIRQLSEQLEKANEELQDSQAIQDTLNGSLTSLTATRDELLQEITQLHIDAQNEDAARSAAGKELLAEHSGVLAGKNFEVSELKNQISRTETYADDLRRQLQDQLVLTEGLETRKKHLEVSLASANAEVREFSDRIEELKSQNSDLIDEKSRLQKDLEKEVRQIRLELGEAQETVADRESLSEQLTSDLFDTKSFSSRLENRLSDAEKENKATIAKLKKKLQKIEALNDELNYKLSNKDNALAGMLSELSKRSKEIKSTDAIEDVIHELDGRISEQIDDTSGVEKARVTRLLIGNIDGQELRFPLFKDRLTIGRTVHNDIQLNAPYISRRHAAVVTDEDGTRIIDSGSKNGVYVNSKRVTEQPLFNGDLVTIGSADFKFEEIPKR